MSVRGSRSGGHRASGCLLLVPHMYADGDLVPRPADSSTARHTLLTAHSQYCSKSMGIYKYLNPPVGRARGGGGEFCRILGPKSVGK